MKKDNRISPVGLKGNEINERMKELMGIKPINENHSTSVVELTKIGPDGNAYAIVRENHEYYIKTTVKKSNLISEDFKYIGGLQNKKSEAYPSYAKAIKHLNLKFNSLAESFDAGHNINVFKSDNLVKENGLNGGYMDMPKGGGFTGEGNLEGNEKLQVEGDWQDEPGMTGEGSTTIVEEELSEAEQAVENMGKCSHGIKEGEACKKCDATKEMTDKEKSFAALAKPKDKITYADKIAGAKKEGLNEHKLSILKAINDMDAIIDSLTEGTIKKKVYTIK
jgi:hypothetical protein